MAIGRCRSSLPTIWCSWSDRLGSRYRMTTLYQFEGLDLYILHIRIRKKNKPWSMLQAEISTSCHGDTWGFSSQDPALLSLNLPLLGSFIFENNRVEFFTNLEHPDYDRFYRVCRVWAFKWSYPACDNLEQKGETRIFINTWGHQRIIAWKLENHVIVLEAYLELLEAASTMVLMY